MILCSDGCRAWTEENYKDPACNNGESASQAVIARKDYESDSVGMKVKNALLNGGDVKLAGMSMLAFMRFADAAKKSDCCCSKPDHHQKPEECMLNVEG